MKILKLHLETFRHFNDVNIEFGERITVISGQNGTGKSSVLGWVTPLSGMFINVTPVERNLQLSEAFSWIPLKKII